MNDTDQVTSAARVVVRAIRRDAKAGAFEGATAIADLTTLHDFVDANEYLLEVAQDFGASEAFDPFGDEWFAWVVEVERAVDAILAGSPVVAR